MAIKPIDLTATKSEVAAELLAVTIWDAANILPPNGPVAEVARRALRRHAKELLSLYDIKADEVLTTPASTPAPLAPVNDYGTEG